MSNDKPYSCFYDLVALKRAIVFINKSQYNLFCPLSCHEVHPFVWAVVLRASLMVVACVPVDINRKYFGQ
jgi:hypothetical protein